MVFLHGNHMHQNTSNSVQVLLHNAYDSLLSSICHRYNNQWFWQIYRMDPHNLTSQLTKMLCAISSTKFPFHIFSPLNSFAINSINESTGAPADFMDEALHQSLQCGVWKLTSRKELFFKQFTIPSLSIRQKYWWYFTCS